VIVRALLVALCLGALLAPAASAQTPGSQPTSAPTSTDPNALSVPETLNRPPINHALTGDKAIAIANRQPKVIDTKRHHKGTYSRAFLKGTDRWQISYYDPHDGDKEVAQVIISDRTGQVTEAWTGFQVAWTMARGYPGAFGRKVNSPWGWIPLTLLFVAPFVDPRRPLRMLHLDLLVLVSFGFSVAFFNDAYQYNTIKTTFMLALPTTVAVVLVALFLAYGMRRGIWFERTITTILVLPISLGVVFLSEGILGFYGHNGWLNQLLLAVGLIQNPLELTHNSIGVIFSLFMQNFPFCFLMLLGYISGIDPSLESSARMLGAGPWTIFRRVMFPLIAPGLIIAFALVFVMSFAVFPSAVMVGQPAGSTRTISIAAYQQAFEQYDMSYASAIAVIMGLCQLAALVVIVLVRRRMTIATTMGVGKR